MIVYQIFVDRFDYGKDYCFNSDKKEKEHLYPGGLKKWDTKPRRGVLSKEDGCYTHELEFWGGDLAGITKRISYLEELGVSILYLTPICLARTNHKYDTIDYFQIDPQFGTLDDLKKLVKTAHNSGIQVVMDCVFNHVGKTNPWFQEALNNPDSEYRDFFYFSEELPGGYKAWANVRNLPELNLENPALEKKILSVIAHYLKIVDGIRLDVAFELGPKLLQKITRFAHKVKPGSFVIGEIWSYPGEWLKKVDGIMNYNLRQLIIEYVQGNMESLQFGRIIEKIVQDVGIKSLLQCWNILSSHDTMRIKNLFPDDELRKIALLLQFSLPGKPMIYYGEELGMTGENDPANRGPMEWLDEDGEQDWIFYETMISMHRENPALQHGDFVLLETKNILAFCRKTDIFKEFVLVVINAGKKPVQEVLAVPEYRLTNAAKLEDIITKMQYENMSGFLKIRMQPRSFLVLTPVIKDKAGYNPYKRIQ